MYIYSVLAAQFLISRSSGFIIAFVVYFFWYWILNNYICINSMTIILIKCI